MKNPKECASEVAKTLGETIKHMNSSFNFDHHIIIGDSNLEKSYGTLPSNFVEIINTTTQLNIQFTKSNNTQSTTNKQRGYLQGQPTKAKKEIHEEKDFVACSNKLTTTSVNLFPQPSNSSSNNLYPSLDKMLPAHDWQTDHLALTVTIEETPSIPDKDY